MIGKLVGGRYRIDTGIGIGGMSRVWRARDERHSGRLVALKQNRADLGRADELRTRLLNEAEALRLIDHPGVVGVHGVVDHDDELWLVMDYVEGMTLKQGVAEGPFDERKAAEIGIAVLDSLDAVHGARVWHRDIKPENILIASSGRIVLVDFGIAAIEGVSGLTRTGMMFGTVDYTAPERFAGAPADGRSDLWSLGATLYRLVEDRSPFQRGNMAATMYAIRNEQPHTARRLVEIRPVIESLMAKDPAKRPNTAGARRALADILIPRPPHLTPGIPRQPRPRLTLDAGATRVVRLALERGDAEAAASTILALPGLPALLLLKDLKDAEAQQVIEQLCADPDRLAEILHRTTPDVAGRLLSGAHNRRSVASVLRRMDASRAGRILATMQPRTAAAVVEALAELGADYPSVVILRPAREAANVLLYVSLDVRQHVYDAAPTLWRTEVRFHIRKMN